MSVVLLGLCCWLDYRCCDRILDRVPDHFGVRPGGGFAGGRQDDDLHAAVGGPAGHGVGGGHRPLIGVSRRLHPFGGDAVPAGHLPEDGGGPGGGQFPVRRVPAADGDVVGVAFDGQVVGQFGQRRRQMVDEAAAFGGEVGFAGGEQH